MNKLFFITLLLLGESWGANPCGITVSLSPIVFDTFDQTDIKAHNITLKRSNLGNGCRFHQIGITKGRSRNYNTRQLFSPGNEFLHFNVHKDQTTNSVLKDINDARNANEILSASFGNGSSQITVDFVAKFPVPNRNRTFWAKNLYSDTLQVNVKQTQGNGSVSHNLPVSINIPPILFLSLVDQGSDFDSNDNRQTLDFGVLQEDEEQRFDIVLKSNAGYSLKASSTNQGKLKRAGGSSTIDYQMRVGGTTINLNNNNVEIDRGSGVTRERGERIRVRVKIGNIDNKTAGSYQDIITLSLMATE